MNVSRVVPPLIENQAGNSGLKSGNGLPKRIMPMAKVSRDSKSLTAQTTGRLRQAGLRPTRQRVELASLLFRDHDRHVTA